MTLLGRWNWWAPQSFKRLHAKLGLREHPLPDPEPVDTDDLVTADQRT
jgi:RND superfamily putative drug exporter